MKIPAKYRRKAVLNDHFRSWTINWRLLEGENTFQFYEDAVLKKNVSNKFDQKNFRNLKRSQNHQFSWDFQMLLLAHIDIGVPLTKVKQLFPWIHVNVLWGSTNAIFRGVNVYKQCYNGDQLKTCDLFPCTHIKLMMRRASLSKKKKSARHPVPGCALH